MESNNYNAAETPVETAPALSMKWRKFLIYFSLWLNAGLNLYDAYLYFTGAAYGVSASELKWIYRYYEGLQTLDLSYGVICVLIAVFAVVTCLSLARYKAIGPKFLTILYIANLAFSLLYLPLCSAVTEIAIGELLEGDFARNIATSIAMIIANKKYYAQRAHLFVN